MFDKVCVIYEGKQVFFGPADRAREYFIDMGYEPANRQTTADFLVAGKCFSSSRDENLLMRPLVTDPKGRIVRKGFENRVPRTADEFVAHWHKSELARLNREDMAAYRDQFVGKPERVTYYQQSVKAEHAKRTNHKSPYIVSIPMQVRSLMRRRVQILAGNASAQIIQMASFVIQAIIMGTVFLKVSESTSTYFSCGGVLYL